MSKIRTWWMDTDILEKALDNCDLGDGYSAKVRMHPHKDMLAELTQVIAFEDHQEIVKGLEARINRLRKALKFYCDYTEFREIPRRGEYARQALAEA